MQMCNFSNSEVVQNTELFNNKGHVCAHVCTCELHLNRDDNSL